MSSQRRFTQVFLLGAVGFLLTACEALTHAGSYDVGSGDGGGVSVVIECGINETMCPAEGGTICANFLTDDANCNGCGQACADAKVCSGGRCQASCAPGETHCSNGCVDIDTNAQNCGSCGHACASGQVCSGGACADKCADDAQQCGSACEPVDFGTECGVCASPVTTTSASVRATCSGTCVAGYCLSCKSTCGGSCVDPLTDPANCGACGNACDALQQCVNGSCCATGSVCNGACTDLTTVLDCGACGVKCDVSAGQRCSAGLCCRAGQANCNGACVDVTTDRANCGGCGATCTSGSVCTRTLATSAQPASGACIACPATIDHGTGDVSAENVAVCGDACVDLDWDTSNCGACGTKCGAMEYCQLAATSPQPLVASCTACGAIDDDHDSSTQQIAVCGDTCVDLMFDAANCGKCGTICPLTGAKGAQHQEACCMGACIGSICSD